jgi:hypothetical protein
VTIAAAAIVDHGSWPKTASHVKTASQPDSSATTARSAKSRSPAYGITAPNRMSTTLPAHQRWDAVTQTGKGESIGPPARRVGQTRRTRQGHCPFECPDPVVGLVRADAME